MSAGPLSRHLGGLRWEGIPVEAYKPEGGHFRDVARQRLFGGEEGARSELRYFEVGPGGWTTLERHRHRHQVMVLSGRGRALVDGRLFDLRPFDLVRVPAQAWHQFRAAEKEQLGFLCLVERERDRPQRPTAEELEALRSDPELADFLRA